MRITSFIFCCLMVLGATSLNAQDKAPASLEPEYTGRIVYLNNDSPVPLEQQKASTAAKAGASIYVIGMGKVRASNKVRGLESPVRIKKDGVHQFIARVADNDVDPTLVVNIFKLEQKKKGNAAKSYRFIEIGSLGTFSGSSALDIDFITFDAKRYGESSYLITISQPLDAGEYAITIDTSRELFNMFGVN